MTNDPNPFLLELLSAIEKQHGPIEYFTVCQSPEDNPEFQRIAGIGETTPCEELGCTALSVNCCYACTKAICERHSHDARAEVYDGISEVGDEVVCVCAGCRE